MVTLLISDVPGDDPAVIACGPTVPDPTTCADALAILARYGIDAAARGAAPSARRPLARRPSPATRASPGTRSRMIAAPQHALEAAAAAARGAGVTPAHPGRRASRARRARSAR